MHTGVVYKAAAVISLWHCLELELHGTYVVEKQKPEN
jgi:hypothetical protein